MSSVIKGVAKVFKKVVKVVKKIAPVVLGVGALVFTGGAALGLPGIIGGGWTAAATAVGQTLGGTGLLGSVLTGAITQAGQGALIGGAISGLTGGSISQGLKRGAAVGAVTGGLLGAGSHLRANMPKPVDPRNVAQSQGVTIDGATGEVIEGGAKTFPYPETNLGAGTAINAAGSPVNRGLLSNVGGFIKRNPELVGGIAQGVGGALMAGAEADADIEYLRERERLRRENYAGAEPGRGFRQAASGTSTQTPTDRFDPAAYGNWEYQYNPQTRKIERVPLSG